MILLDTNVLSELMKDNADPAVEHWYVAHAAEIAISTPTIAEIAFGIAKLPQGKRRDGLAQRLIEWRLRLNAHSYAFMTTTAMIYGDIMAEALANKHNMAVIDGQIAAISVEHGCTLATRNVRDFECVSIQIINPWDA